MGNEAFTQTRRLVKRVSFKRRMIGDLVHEAAYESLPRCLEFGRGAANRAGGSEMSRG